MAGKTFVMEHQVDHEPFPTARFRAFLQPQLVQLPKYDNLGGVEVMNRFVEEPTLFNVESETVEMVSFTHFEEVIVPEYNRFVKHQIELINKRALVLERAVNRLKHSISAENYEDIMNTLRGLN